MTTSLRPDQELVGRDGGVIFDMDGLLLDTEAVARLAWQEAARTSGHEMSDALFAKMVGHSKKDCLELLREAFGSSFDFEAMSESTAQYFQAHLAKEGVPLKAGTLELLQALSALGIPLAVATSTRNPQARELLAQAGLTGFFRALVTGDEIFQGKPAPDIYLEAVRRLRVDPAQSLALEDSHAGVRAAHAAGLKVIMVPDLLSATEEIASLTLGVLPSLLEVKRLMIGDPPGLKT